MEDEIKTVSKNISIKTENSKQKDKNKFLLDYYLPAFGSLDDLTVPTGVFPDLYIILLCTSAAVQASGLTNSVAVITATNPLRNELPKPCLLSKALVL